ncbi:MAG TPA: hypothetical protein VF634_03475 [Pyrinomonadaceae bacterium]
MMKCFCVAARSLLLMLALCFASQAQDHRDTSPPPPNVDPFDAFNELSREDEQARLDNLAVALLNAPGWMGQIIIYAGRKSCAGAAQARAMRMKKYLAERRGVESNRIIWRDAGYFEKPYVVFWLARPGHLRPLPFSRSDTLSPAEAQIINCKSKKQRRKKR